MGNGYRLQGTGYRLWGTGYRGMRQLKSKQKCVTKIVKNSRNRQQAARQRWRQNADKRERESGQKEINAAQR